MQIKKLQQNKGFALLITLVVVSVITAIGLSMLQITLKQFTLSTVARESEIAFHAASSGMECMQYHRSVDSTKADFLSGGLGPTLSCAGVPSVGVPVTDHVVPHAFNYIYKYNVDGDKCVEVSIHLIDARTRTSPYTRNVNEGLETISCEAGLLCTTIFSRGFNRSCNDTTSLYTVQRELTAQF